ncbi:MAG: aminofutalosine synthase MqnE [Bacteroidales bacterium]|nr:aminofutalosine synthase MqnE [Bacteroidales bacterium]HOY39598.1 aminofutalosine synthase MqnE [Bacteroidales bacterium]HQP05188.1 aminofutalosine synthase MqnE [Bacteroidales bacterium]
MDKLNIEPREKQVSDGIRKITDKIKLSQRLNRNDALFLYEHFPLGLLGELAFEWKRKISGDSVYFNRNIHIEITNICVNRCRFCSYYRDATSRDSWSLSMQDVLEIIREKYIEGITEVHIVGGLNANYYLNFYTALFEQISALYPDLHIKAFTAVEIEHLARTSGRSIDSCIQSLKNAGLDSVAGGGAEIFNKAVRMRICEKKISAETWLSIHKELHKNNIPSNCTMLYGHIESYSDRVNHLMRLRKLQDETQGFNCFIPLKFKNSNNKLSSVPESNLAEDLRNIAVCRLVLDNIPHIKAYWPMLGKETARLCLHFGADDIDGTIHDTTKIYSMAGSVEKRPVFDAWDINNAIRSEGFQAIERDSLYNKISPKR